MLLFGGTKAGTSFTLDCQKLHYKEMSVSAMYYHTPYHVKKTFELLCNGYLDGKKFITQTCPYQKPFKAGLQAIDMGRNIFQAEDSKAMVKAVDKIVYRRFTDEEATSSILILRKNKEPFHESRPYWCSR